jgi:hypothetical protein
MDIITIAALVIGFGIGWVVMGWFGGTSSDIDSIEDYDRDERYSLSSKLTKMMEEDDEPMFPSIDMNNFEAIWVAENCKRDYGVAKRLSDNEYIKYHIWERDNWKAMHAKHLPDHKVMRGVNPNIIFHGGCLSCVSQEKHGVDRCKGCLYFKFEHHKPKLKIGSVSKTPQQIETIG